jgi:sterol desaturase/sphingolipid hydroxylase (fatty acid hydroxylase superfamily)
MPGACRSTSGAQETCRHTEGYPPIRAGRDIQDNLVIDHFDYLLIGEGVVVATLAYWMAVLFYTLIPLGFPRYAARYKLQSKAKVLPVRMHARLILLTLFNQLAVSFLFIVLIGEPYYYLGGQNKLYFPAWHVVLLHFLLFAILFDVLFYFGHRLLHTPFLYRRIHALHHRFQAPVPYSGACVHPVEFIFAYIIPNLAAATLFDFSVPEYVLFVSIEYIHNVHDHCGYHFPWDPFGYICGQNAPHHDEHHRLYRVNYSGAFTMVLDRLFGTYRAPPGIVRAVNENG